MAEWTNLFELGECTVEVYFGGDAAVIYSGVLGKGDSDTFQDSAARSYSIGVSSVGAVTMDGGDDISSAYYEVRVIPAYSHDYPARIRNASFGANVNSALGIIEALGSEAGVDSLPYDTVSPASPEPLDMSALTGTRTLVAVSFQNGGIG